ncbi:hypothetical protein [Halorussus halobius]|uniref:hypothetical protein n=1 Tax=Halorussus halobius TaxID=1710537 RepID=UPI001092899F|nr:hypothetical protein [Halorussus halobius]
MVSKAFFTGSKYLVEDNDGRHDYLRFDDERFLSALAAAGRKVYRAPFAADEAKGRYLAALVAINDSYFAAREYEDDATGKYLKHDERAERRFRVRTAQRLSDAVADLRSLLSAHDALVSAGLDHVDRTVDPSERDRIRSIVRSTVLGCTDRAVAEGWLPVVEAYYYSLSPGELVAEDRERRKQRLEGTEESVGIRELLDRPGMERLARGDVRRIRRLDRESPGADPRVWKRLLDDYPWYVARDDEGDDGEHDDGGDDEGDDGSDRTLAADRTPDG